MWQACCVDKDNIDRECSQGSDYFIKALRCCQWNSVCQWGFLIFADLTRLKISGHVKFPLLLDLPVAGKDSRYSLYSLIVCCDDPLHESEPLPVHCLGASWPWSRYGSLHLSRLEEWCLVPLRWFQDSSSYFRARASRQFWSLHSFLQKVEIDYFSPFMI